MRMFVTAIASVLLVTQVHAAASSRSDIDWRRDVEVARIQAARVGRPVLIVVGSLECGWCRKLERTTLRDPGIIAAVGRETVPVMLSADDPRNEGIIAALEVQGLPGLVLLDAQGRVRARHEGYLDSRRFLAWLREQTPR